MSVNDNSVAFLRGVKSARECSVFHNKLACGGSSPERKDERALVSDGHLSLQQKLFCAESLSARPVPSLTHRL